MPGRIRSSFRAGNLAEHLGLLLLKGIAAVADVTRPEDVGLDAIATLLRRSNGGNCYAEDPFLIQLKAASVRTLRYKDHQLDWFVSQMQPLFVGLVSLAKSQISLYPTIYVNQAVLSLHAKKMTIHFGPSALAPFLPGQKWSPWTSDSDEGAAVWLGPPLLQWTLGDLVNPSWATQTYKTLKRFIGLARREIELQSFGQCSVISWSTNDESSITSQSGMMKGHPGDLASLGNRCAPCLRAIMLHSFTMPAEVGNSLTLCLLALAAALRKSGVEIDPDNLFGKFFFALNKRSEKHD